MAPTTVHVKATSGTKITVSVELSLTVAELKATLSAEDKANVPANQQRLIYRGHVMKDERALESYGLAAEHTVLVKGSRQVAQPRPRPPPRRPRRRLRCPTPPRTPSRRRRTSVPRGPREALEASEAASEAGEASEAWEAWAASAAWVVTSRRCSSRWRRTRR